MPLLPGSLLPSKGIWPTGGGTPRQYQPGGCLVACRERPPQNVAGFTPMRRQYNLEQFCDMLVHSSVSFFLIWIWLYILIYASTLVHFFETTHMYGSFNCFHFIPIPDVENLHILNKFISPFQCDSYCGTSCHVTFVYTHLFGYCMQ